MTSHGHFTDGNSPHVQIVQVNDVIATLVSNVLSELFNVDLLGCTLHHDSNNVLNDGNGREQNNEREQVCAKWVSIPILREEIDNYGGDDHSNAHEHVSEDVKERGVDVDV